MKKIIGITSVLLFAVISVAYLYFSGLNSQSRNNDLILSEIPASAAIILEYPNDRSLYEIFKDYSLFDTIIGNRNKKENDWLKDNLLESDQPENLLSGQKVILSLHPSAKDTVDFLWSVALKDPVNNDQIAEILRKSASQFTIENVGPNLRITASELKRPFYLSTSKGIIRGSFSKFILDECMNADAKKIEKSFVKEISEGLKKNENALTNLFINYRKPGLLTPFLRRIHPGNLELFNNISGFSALSLNFKSDALMFNGITSINDKSNTYIKLYLHQSPIKNTLKRVFPYNTANSVTYGVSSYPLFHKDLTELFNQRKSTEVLQKQLELITAESGLNPDRDIKKLWGDEMSTLQLSTHESLAIIKTTDGSKLQFFLEPVSSLYGGQIRKMNYAGIFDYYWGDPLQKYQKPFFAIIDNLIIISNSANTINKYLEDYNSSRFLYTEDAFTQFDQLVADQANISFIFNLRNSNSIIRTLFKKGYADNFRSSSYGLRDLYAISFQLSANKDHFFTNFYTGYKITKPVEELYFNVDSIIKED